jgi:hypothetical protein
MRRYLTTWESKRIINHTQKILLSATQSYKLQSQLQKWLEDAIFFDNPDCTQCQFGLNNREHNKIYLVDALAARDETPLNHKAHQGQMQLILAVTLVKLTIKLNFAAFGFINTKILYHQIADIVYQLIINENCILWYTPVCCTHVGKVIESFKI